MHIRSKFRPRACSGLESCKMLRFIGSFSTDVSHLFAKFRNETISAYLIISRSFIQVFFEVRNRLSTDDCHYWKSLTAKRVIAISMLLSLTVIFLTNKPLNQERDEYIHIRLIFHQLQTIKFKFPDIFFFSNACRGIVLIRIVSCLLICMHL